MIDPQKHYTVPLVDLGGGGQRDPRFAGLLAPQAPGATEAAGVTSALFLENAAEYHQKYQAVEYFAGLIQTALGRIELPGKVEAILDIGSGSGNSVIPLLRTFPDAHMVATDISPQLLLILRDFVRENVPAARPGNLSLVCADAAKDFFVPGTFDLAVGSAILHHILNPEDTVRAVLGALKPGASAIFFEPFENGNAMLRLAYQRILSDDRAKKLPQVVINALAHMLHSYHLMMDLATDAPERLKLDDKWAFTRGYFYQMARRLGAADVAVYPLHGVDNPFTNQTVVNLRVMGAAPEAMPPWAWDVVGQFDGLLSARMKEELLIEGCVIFRK